MVSGYETLVIAHPDISDEELQELIDKMKNGISLGKGEILKIDRWGKRKLVYKIKGLSKGSFFVVYYLGNPALLQAIDKILRFNEKVIRYQTVKLEKNVDIENLREKVTQEKIEPPANEEVIATPELSEGAQEVTGA